MTKRNITQADLNLLTALDVLLAEQNVTRAADRLGLTQSAVSRILGRLRATLGDPLFVRTSRGLTPTERALAIAGPLRQNIESLERLFLERPRFDPTTVKRRFRVAAVDYAQVTLLAPLLRRLSTDAPQAEFEVRQPSLESERDLDAGVLDILIMPQQASAPGVVWTPLYHDGYTCVVWKKNSVRSLTPARFAAMEHILVAPRERAGGIVDEVLKESGLARRVAVQIPTFLLLPHVLIATQRIATIPTGMAAELLRMHPLKIVKSPVQIPGFTMSQGWHEIHRHDPGHRWLREVLAREAAKNNSDRAGRSK
ncbi:MAG TPA: LysR family transcriptional regulator [Acidobacteriota bacterium]|nr:LysR family transcriptional regulator [Acidobacteriota bacterium]